MILVFFKWKLYQKIKNGIYYKNVKIICNNGMKKSK